MPEQKTCPGCSTKLDPQERHITQESCIRAIGERVAKIEAMIPKDNEPTPSSPEPAKTA